MASSPFGGINPTDSSDPNATQNVATDTPVDSSAEVEALKQELAAARAALAAKAAESVKAATATADARTEYRVSCLPIQRYHLGRFHFDNGFLLLSAKDYEEFLALLNQQPMEEQFKFSLMPSDYSPTQLQGTKMVSGIDTTANTLIDGAGQV